MLKKLLIFAKDSAIYGMGGVLERAVGLLLIPLYTRFLRVEDYGVLAMLNIVGMFFDVFAFLGMRSAVFREYTLADDEKARAHVVMNGVATVTALSLALLVGATLFRSQLSNILLGTEEFGSLVVWSAIGAALSAATTIPQQVLQAERRARTAAGLNLSKLLITTSTTIVLVVSARQGVWGVVLATCLANGLFAIGMLAATIRRFGVVVDGRLWLKMHNYGIHFVPFRILSVGIAVFADYAVRHMLGLREAGLFSVANRFAVPVAVVATATNQAWVAYKFKIHKEESDAPSLFRSITTYYVAAMLGLWVLVALWGPELLRWLTPAQFHAGAGLIPALALARLTLAVYSMFSTGIELSENPKSLWMASAAGLVVGLASTFALIPFLGALGAAIASVLGYLAMTAAVYSIARRQVHIEHDWGALLGATACAFVVVLAAQVIGNGSLVTRLSLLVALTVAFPIMSLMVLARSSSERQRVGRTLRRLGFGLGIRR